MKRLVLLVLVLPALALADAAPADAKRIFLENILPVLATALGSLLVWGVAHLGALLRGLAKETAWSASVDQLTDLAQHAVEHVEAVERPALVGALQDGNGKLTPEAGAKLKGLAMDAVKDSMPPDLEKKLGYALETMVSGAIEKAVRGLKS